VDERGFLFDEEEYDSVRIAGLIEDKIWKHYAYAWDFCPPTREHGLGRGPGPLLVPRNSPIFPGPQQVFCPSIGIPPFFFLDSAASARFHKKKDTQCHLK